jgi:hypothetical protein
MFRNRMLVSTFWLVLCFGVSKLAGQSTTTATNAVVPTLAAGNRCSPGALTARQSSSPSLIASAAITCTRNFTARPRSRASSGLGVRK